MLIELEVSCGRVNRGKKSYMMCRTNKMYLCDSKRVTWVRLFKVIFVDFWE